MGAPTPTTQLGRYSLDPAMPATPSNPAATPAPLPRSPGALVRLAARIGRVGAWSWEVGAPRTRLTREGCDLLGLAAGSEPTPAQALDCFAPADRARLRRSFMRCLREGIAFELQAQVAHRGDERTWVRVIGEADRDPQGGATRMQGALVDITAAQLAQQKLHENRRTLATLIGNLPGMVYRCQYAPDWPLTFASERALELTGYTAAELVAGRPNYGNLIHPDDRAAVQAQVDQAVRQRRNFHLTYRLRSRSSEEKWVWEQGSGVFDPDGRLRCLEGFISDVTFAKRIEAQLNQLNHQLEDRVRERTSQLEAANAEMEAVAYSIAHDLRAPITSLGGFARLLQQSLPALDGRPAHYLRRIGRNVDQMSELIDALLSLARLSSVTVAREPVDLGALARTALDTLREQEPQRATAISIAPGLATHGDRRLLQQVLANLLGNAWKFSRTRAITTIEVGRCPGEAGETVFYVRDHGVGFDMAHASRVFGVFQRLHPAGEFEGTGIGLTLVRKIVQCHGGRVWAEAEVGRGATFFFTLDSR